MRIAKVLLFLAGCCAFAPAFAEYSPYERTIYRDKKADPLSPWYVSAEMNYSDFVFDASTHKSLSFGYRDDPDESNWAYEFHYTSIQKLSRIDSLGNQDTFGARVFEFAPLYTLYTGDWVRAYFKFGFDRVREAGTVGGTPARGYYNSFSPGLGLILPITRHFNGVAELNFYRMRSKEFAGNVNSGAIGIQYQF